MESGWAEAELAGAELWDGRCRCSLAEIGERLAQQPECSFSAALGAGLRQAARRIFAHPTTTVTGLLAGHTLQTAQRCGEYERVLAIQDSTEFDYTTHKKTTGLGPLGRGLTRGLMGHSVLAVTPDGLPLGVLHLALWARDPAQRGQRHARRKRTTAQKESQKWLDGLAATEAALPPEQPVLLVADREADVFAYLAAPRRENTDLLIRACRPRTVIVAAAGDDRPERVSLLAVARQAPVVGAAAPPPEGGGTDRAGRGADRLCDRARASRGGEADPVDPGDHAGRARRGGGAPGGAGLCAAVGD